MCNHIPIPYCCLFLLRHMLLQEYKSNQEFLFLLQRVFLPKFCFEFLSCLSTFGVSLYPSFLDSKQYLYGHNVSMSFHIFVLAEVLNNMKSTVQISKS